MNFGKAQTFLLDDTNHPITMNKETKIGLNKNMTQLV